MIVRISRVDQPPVSGVPVAGANAGSIVSMSIDRYTGEFLPGEHHQQNVTLPISPSLHLPTRSWIFLMIPAVPMVSISLASTISNPT